MSTSKRLVRSTPIFFFYRYARKTKFQLSYEVPVIFNHQQKHPNQD